MGDFSDAVRAGDTPFNYFTVTSSTTAFSYAEKTGTGNQREVTSIKVQNQSSVGGENILVSTDGGSKFFAVTPLAEHDEFINDSHEIHIKSATGTPAYDLWFTVKP